MERGVPEMKAAMGFLDNLIRTMAGRPEAPELDESERLRLEVLRLYQDGRLAEAEQAARRLVDLQRERVGEAHPDHASALNNLALLIQQQGDLDAAEPLLRRALEIRRGAFGEEHPDYAAGLNNLALLLCERGDLDAAEPLLRQGLEVRRRALGEDHPDYATALGSLALLHCERRDFDAAEPLLRQALEVRSLALGEAHPDYATSLNNLALLHGERGDFDAAEPLLRRALEIRRQALGDQHPDTVSSADSLSMLLLRKGSTAVGTARPARDEVGGDRRGSDAGRREETPASPAAIGPGRPGGPGGLADDLATLTRRFHDASELLLQEAARMQGPGLPPNVGALSAASACQRDFMALRAEALRRAERLHVRSHQPERVAGLHDLGDLLDAIARAEVERSAQEETRRRALDVLERVLALGCRDAGDRTHLEAGQTRAGVLHDAISACPADELPRDAERLRRGDHPFACLLALVEDDDPSGEAWSDRYRETVSAFGPGLAVAAARGRISPPQDRDAEAPECAPALEAEPV